MHRKRCVTFALWLAAMLAPSVALADGIEGWVADRLAEEILAGVPVGATDAEPRIAVQSFAAEKTPISLTAANALNASLLSALISKSGGRHTFVARGALPALVRDVSERARPGPDDPVETLLENARADILVIGTLRRERQQLVLSYKAVATGDGAVLASTKSYRLRLRDQDQATLGLDQALPVAARYLLQRVDGLESIQIGDIRYRSEAADTAFAAYLQDRVADEFRRQSTGVLTGAGVLVGVSDTDTILAPGAYRLIGTYWPLSEAVEVSLSLRGVDGIAVTWREKVRRDSIPATLAIGPAADPVPTPKVLPRQQTQPKPQLTYATPVRGRPTVAEAQRLLHALGYDPGPVNGILGPQMRRAIAMFQRNDGLGQDGRMTRGLVASLRERQR